MSIKDIFLGERNINRMTQYLGEKLDIEDTKEAKMACRKLLVTQMEFVFKKNQNKIIQIDPGIILPKLNDKSIEETIKVYVNHRRKSSTSNTNRNDGKQPPKNSMKGPSQSQGRSLSSISSTKQGKQKGPSGMYSGFGDSNYASISNDVSCDNGEFITATGEIGKKMFFGNIGQQMQMNDKMYDKDDIDRQVLLRQSEYENSNGTGPMGMNMGGNTMGQMSQMDQGQMGQIGQMGQMGQMGSFQDPMSSMNLGYNPMMGNNARPPEINFAIDGGDTRGIAHGSIDGNGKNGQNGYNHMMDMNSGRFSENGTWHGAPSQSGYGYDMGNNGSPGSGGMGMGGMNMGMGSIGMGGMNMGMGGMNMNMGGMNMGGMNGNANMDNNNDFKSSRNKNNGGSDIDSRLAQLEVERSDYNSNNLNMANMGNMGNGGYGNFNMGGFQGGNVMSGFNNQKYHTGNNRGNQELEELVKDQKRELANKKGLDPESLMHLSPQQIEDLLSNKKHNHSDNDSDSDSNSDSSSDNDNSDKKLQFKDILIKKLREKQKEKKKHQKKLSKEVNNVLNDINNKLSKSKNKKSKKSDTIDTVSDSDDESCTGSDDEPKTTKTAKRVKRVKRVKTVKKAKPTKSITKPVTEPITKPTTKITAKSKEPYAKKINGQQKPVTKSKVHSGSDVESESNSESNNSSESDNDSSESLSSSSSSSSSSSLSSSNSKLKQMNSVDIKIRKRSAKENKNSITESHDESQYKKQILTVKSDSWTEPEFYNNYRVELDTPITNFKKMSVNGTSDFPMLTPLIDEDHNTFCIIYNKQKIPVVLDPKIEYRLSDIVDGINAVLDYDNIPIQIEVNKHNHVIVENKSGDIFSLDLTQNSIGEYLGFNNQTYKDKSMYSSENPHMFLEQSYYMFIKEISPNDPICEITPQGEIIQLIQSFTDNDLKIKSTQNKYIKEFTFQFRYDKHKDSSLVIFYEEPHSFSFDLYFLDNKNEENKKPLRRSTFRR